jgi:hypothetical protein
MLQGRLGVVVPISRLKILDHAQLDARFGSLGAAKVLRVLERRASWRRVLTLLERSATAAIDLPSKLPGRRLRKAKLRLFRSFKLLGALKATATEWRGAAGSCSPRPAN